MTTIEVEANGLRFEVATWGSGERLALCLHGFPETAACWRHQGEFLAARGFRVWAPNQRGYGASSRPRARAAYDLAHLVADVAALIDASGARSVTLIGHDWGAMVAWCFALRRARPLERLVILNVPHPARMRRRFLTTEQMLRSWYVGFFQIPWLPERVLGLAGGLPVVAAIRRTSLRPECFPEHVLDGYRANATRPHALRAMLDWYRANVGGGGLRAQLKRGAPVIDVPTLMIWGVRDTALTIDTTFDTGRYVRDLTLRYLPDVSHWVQEEAPDRVNALLGAFLAASA